MPHLSPTDLVGLIVVCYGALRLSWRNVTLNTEVTRQKNNRRGILQ